MTNYANVWILYSDCLGCLGEVSLSPICLKGTRVASRKGVMGKMDKDKGWLIWIFPKPYGGTLSHGSTLVWETLTDVVVLSSKVLHAMLCSKGKPNSKRCLPLCPQMLKQVGKWPWWRWLPHSCFGPRDPLDPA